MRKQPVFFSAHALRDGTIWLAVPVRKPQNDRDIDAEGVCRWFIDKVGENPGLSDLGNATRNICIATCVNVRRVLREKVENRLDALEQSVTAMKSQLDRIEAMLTELVGNRG